MKFLTAMLLLGSSQAIKIDSPSKNDVELKNSISVKTNGKDILPKYRANFHIHSYVKFELPFPSAPANRFPMVTMRKDFMIYAQDPIEENRNQGYHWYVIPGLDGNPNTVSFAYTRTTGATCYMKAL